MNVINAIEVLNTIPLQFSNRLRESEKRFCAKCKTLLSYFYFEHENYLICCPHCHTRTIVSAKSPKEALEKVGINMIPINEKIKKTKKRKYNLTEEQYEKLKARYIENTKFIIEQHKIQLEKVTNGEFLSENDFKPLAHRLIETFSYRNSDGDYERECIDHLFCLENEE